MSIVKNICDVFWSLFLALTIYYSAQDIYLTMRKEALGKAASGIPPLMKFNDTLWGRSNTYNYR